jgi:hypothetical protein
MDTEISHYAKRTDTHAIIEPAYQSPPSRWSQHLGAGATQRYRSLEHSTNRIRCRIEYYGRHDAQRFYEAHWETTGQPLPSLPVYFRAKYHHLDDEQIARIEEFVADLDTDTRTP